ncbi:MAG TPA: SBBP repeat-containing protein, partial [Anaerolineae bacterium]|nr:SBBP repeat-containing protein [Anaerolineae bacterium]
TTAINFPVTPGAYDPTHGGGTCGVAPYIRSCSDAYVARLSADGSAVVYGTYLGGSDDDGAADVAVDSSGRITVAGSTASNNFPTTPGAYDRTFTGGTCGTAPYLYTCNDIFIARLDAAGSTLVYSTFLGGNDDDRVKAIALDSAGQTTLTGSAASQGFPTTPGAYDTSFNGGPRCYNSTGDAYVTRLNANGSALAFSSFLGGSHGDGTFDVAVDNAGRATVVGETCSTDFPTTPQSFDTSLGGIDGFVTRFDADGQNLDYSTFLGGAGSSDHAYGVALDSQGRAIAAGFTTSDGFPTTPGAFDPIYTPGLAGFIAKLDMDPYAPDVFAPIEQPTAGAFVAGMVTISGYAIDRRSPSGTGIDLVHIYLDGPYGTGTIIGAATYGLDRPDIAAQYGERFRYSGWELAWDTTAGLAPGVHRLYLYAHRTTDDTWSLMDPHLVVMAGGHTVWLPVVLRRP